MSAATTRLPSGSGCRLQKAEMDSRNSLSGSSTTPAKGIRQDDAAAARWYREAADHGVAGAQYNLGAMYADGYGIPRNYVEAYKWLSVAAARSPAAQNRDAALKMRELVAENMTLEQIAEARRLARELKAK